MRRIRVVGAALCALFLLGADCGLTRYRIGVEVFDDEGHARGIEWRNLATDSARVEFFWQAASSPGAKDGFTSFRLEEGAIVTLVDLDADLLSVDEVNFGAVDGAGENTLGIIHLDDFYSARSNPFDRSDLRVPLPFIFIDAFEAGSTTSWSYTTGNLPIFVGEAAALEGRFGLGVTLDGSSQVGYVGDESPAAETTYGGSFLVSPNGVELADSSSIVLLEASGDAGIVFRIHLDLEGTD